MESTSPKNIYQIHYSFERLKEIFLNNLDYCKSKLEELLQKEAYQIKKENNNIIFHFNIMDIFKFDIKLLSQKENLDYNFLPDNIKKIIDKNELTLGIDLGTTYSAASVVIDKNIIIIPNDFCQLSTPSYISFIDGKNILLVN